MQKKKNEAESGNQPLTHALLLRRTVAELQQGSKVIPGLSPVSRSLVTQLQKNQQASAKQSTWNCAKLKYCNIREVVMEAAQLGKKPLKVLILS